MATDCFDSWYLHRSKFRLEGPVQPYQFDKLQICQTMDAFRSPDEQKQYLKEISKFGKVYLALAHNLIVGYLVIAPAPNGSPLAVPSVLELKALEVSKYNRHYSLATCLVKAMEQDKELEKFILVAQEKNMPSQQNLTEVENLEGLFRKILIRGGFEDMPCSEQDGRTQDFFMVRRGPKVPQDVIAFFKVLRNSIK